MARQIGVPHILPRAVLLSISLKDTLASWWRPPQRLAHGLCRDEAAPPRWTRVDEPQPQIEPVSGPVASESKLGEVAADSLVLQCREHRASDPEPLSLGH